MLTQCPHCGEVFRVHAEQLRLARGLARCGACERVFSTLDRLVDEDAVGPASRSAAPAARAREAHAPSAAGKEPAARTRSADQNDEYQVLPKRHLSAEQHGILFTAPGSAEGSAAPESEPFISMDGLNAATETQDVPLELEADLRALRGARSPRKSHAGWLIACVVLALLLGAQVLWSYRDLWLVGHPEWRAALSKLCDRVGCDATAPSDPARIELLSRDVRDHPQYRDALLVNATIVNRSVHAQSYPIIELDLFDRGGRLSGVRRFEPHEYLDASIDAHAGMPSGQPVLVVLEVVSPGDDAVSFEFRFL
jgi:predicted Zn finger-like uncharacterized protein